MGKVIMELENSKGNGMSVSVAIQGVTGQLDHTRKGGVCDQGNICGGKF